ncbi:DUF2267 domain-containing protein [Nocardia sp. CA-128927]|uniref:DUF2267 domain-containing protein n=1 Tax=Nocardia sp. CA-128927 TaxID=3239975 RepID=UPI003D9850A8
MSHTRDPFAPAVHSANVWLRHVAHAMATDDRTFAYRATRAWLHTVRDRLEPHAAAHLSAQLPELLRGAYFEGWVPGRTPASHDVNTVLAEFACAAGITDDESVGLMWIVTDAFRDLLSPGLLEHLFSRLPVTLNRVLLGVSPGPNDEETVENRLTDLADRLQTLSEAVTVLARGLEALPDTEPDSDRTATAAQEAHRILLAEHTGISS